MRRVAKHQMRELSGIRLYLEDYYELVEILHKNRLLEVEENDFKQLRGEFSLKITADEYELEKPDDIKSIKQPFVRELDIESRYWMHKWATIEEGPTSSKGFFSNLSLRIHGSRATINFSSSPDMQYSKALEIIEFLKKKRSLRSRISNPRASMAILLLVSVLLGICAMKLALLVNQVSSEKPGSSLFPIINSFSFFVAAIVTLLVPLLFLATSRFGSSTKSKGIALVLKERSQDNTFIQRHKDFLEKLLIAVVGAVVGAFAKSLFDKK